MPIVHRFPFTAIVCLALAIAVHGPVAAQAPPPATQTLDQQLMDEGNKLMDAGQYSDAAAKFEDLVQKYPQVPSVPEANFKAGRAHTQAGEFNEALKAFQRPTEAKNLPAEAASMVELAQSMAPQVLVMKAAKLAPEDQTRKPTLEEAVKQFDAFLAKYPKSEEV